MTLQDKTVTQCALITKFSEEIRSRQDVFLTYLRLAMRLLLRPIPRHFSRCGAKREAAMLRLQLGHTHSLFFHWLYTWPNTSNPGWSTISTNLKKKRLKSMFVFIAAYGNECQKSMSLPTV